MRQPVIAIDNVAAMYAVEPGRKGLAGVTLSVQPERSLAC
jgi:hypothetical protein